MISLNQTSSGNQNKPYFLVNIFVGQNFTRNAKNYQGMLLQFLTLSLIQGWEQGQENHHIQEPSIPLVP